MSDKIYSQLLKFQSELEDDEIKELLYDDEEDFEIDEESMLKEDYTWEGKE